MSRGWHEVWLLVLEDKTKLILRVYRNEFGYWKLSVPIGAGTEVRAAELCAAAGVPVPKILSSGTCLRSFAPGSGLSQATTWTLSAFAEGRFGGKGLTREEREAGKDSVMSRLAALELDGMDTEPLARFESWREHLAYLGDISAGKGDGAAAGPCSVCASAVAAVRQIFEENDVPDVPPTLVHFDLHFGNLTSAKVSKKNSRRARKMKGRGKGKKKRSGEHNGAATILAVVDWEFAGICDPRLELIKCVEEHCRGYIRAMAKRRSKALAGKTGGSGCGGRNRIESGSSSGSSSSSDSDSDSEEVLEEERNKIMQREWERRGEAVFAQFGEEISSKESSLSSLAMASGEASKAVSATTTTKPTNDMTRALGPWLPWAALKRLIDFVLGRTVLRMAEQGRLEICCDLAERLEDCRRSAFWLTKKGIIDIKAHPRVWGWVF